MSLLPEEDPADPSDDESSVNGNSETMNPVPARAQPTHRDPKIAPPETFDGKPADFTAFMAQCTLHITLCTNTFRTDEQRVLFVTSYLRKEPLNWALEVINDPEHPLRHDYAALKNALTKVYGNRAYKLQAEEKILRLSQTGSAVHYAQKFQTLAAPLNFNDDAKCSMFYNGLKPEVQRAITGSGRPDTLAAMIEKAITFDQLFFQQRNREKRTAPESSSFTPTKRRRDNREQDYRRDNREQSYRRDNRNPGYPHREREQRDDAPREYSRENNFLRHTSIPKIP